MKKSATDTQKKAVEAKPAVQKRAPEQFASKGSLCPLFAL